MTRDPQCAATVKVTGRGSHRCPMAGTWRFDHKWYCKPHYHAISREPALSAPEAAPTRD